MTFDNLGLGADILAGVKHQGYTTPTPIQQQAIPVIIQGRDILAGAQTGTGKTAAFTLPLLHILSNKSKARSHRPRALVLAPTRELAAQVGESIALYGKGLSLSTAIIFGGVGINPQIKKLRDGVDIVIGTPGRLLDLVERRSLDLSQIEVLILDEADRMLDMGFINDIKKIIRLIPSKRQTLFFSATYSSQIKSLADTILKNPVLVEVARQNMAAETVAHFVYHVPKSRKRDLLSHLITEKNWNQVLVFTKTKHGANNLAKHLSKDGITTAAIHGNKSQAARTRALADFKDYKVQVLVATDIAARGLDIEKLPHVVNYELPNISEDYVHRIGRTGRAGSTGEAYSLVSPDEAGYLRDIERLIKKTITVKEISGFSTPAPQSSQGARHKSDFKPRQKSTHQGGYRGGRSDDNRDRRSPGAGTPYRGNRSGGGPSSAGSGNRNDRPGDRPGGRSGPSTGGGFKSNSGNPSGRNRKPSGNR